MFHDSLSFLSSDLPAFAGVALDNSGEVAVEGGDVGCSDSPMLASRLSCVSELYWGFH